MKLSLWYEQIKNGAAKLWLVIRHLTDRIDRHHTFMLASGIAFNIMIYMIPLFLLAVFIVSKTIDTDLIINSIEGIFEDFLPPTESNYNFLKSITSEVILITEHSSFFGWIGIGGLLWISSILISSIRFGLNVIFEVDSPAIFILYRLKDILLTVIISILILLYSYAIPIVNFLIDLLDDLFPEFIRELFSGTVLFSVSIFTSFILFYFIFRFVPNRKLNGKIIYLSTAICVVAIEISRHLFAWYITGISNYGKFYGAYAVIMSLAVWIYYSSLILLMSAEISKFWFDKK